MDWCEINKVDYIFGLARNKRLEQAITPALEEARLQSMASGDTAAVLQWHLKLKEAVKISGARSPLDFRHT